MTMCPFRSLFPSYLSSFPLSAPLAAKAGVTGRSCSLGVGTAVALLGSLMFPVEPLRLNSSAQFPESRSCAFFLAGTKRAFPSALEFLALSAALLIWNGRLSACSVFESCTALASLSPPPKMDSLLPDPLSLGRAEKLVCPVPPPPSPGYLIFLRLHTLTFLCSSSARALRAAGRGHTRLLPSFVHVTSSIRGSLPARCNALICLVTAPGIATLFLSS